MLCHDLVRFIDTSAVAYYFDHPVGLYSTHEVHDSIACLVVISLVIA